jgi:hypothetical protein
MLGADLAVGAAAKAARLSMHAGAAGWGATAAVARLASSLPGADAAGRLLATAADPLVSEGRDARTRAASTIEAAAQKLLEILVPEAVDAIDIDRLVRRIDIDALVHRIEIDDVVSRIEIDALVSRIDIDKLVGLIDIDKLVQRIAIDELVGRIDIDELVGRIDIDDVVSRIEIDALVKRIDIDKLVQRIAIDALVKRIEIDELVGRIDIDALVERVDVNELVHRVDIDAVVEETELGTIVARSTSGVATQALDAARSQTARVDTRLSRAVNRALRRKEGEVPIGPPLLTGEATAQPAPAGTDGETTPEAPE